MDIVERLRKRAATWVSVGWGNNDIFDEAANEIERLWNKVQWLEMCETTVVKQDNEIERLRGNEKKYQAIISKLIAKKVADEYWSKVLHSDGVDPWAALKEAE